MMASRTLCGGCGSPTLERLFSLGDMPLVNRFPDHENARAESKYPLDLAGCRYCALIQLEATPPPAELFCDYQHLSSASQSNLAHLRSVSAELRRLTPGAGRVLEIGSNDGSLLVELASWAPRVIGVDPARGLAARLPRQNIEVTEAFFDEIQAEGLRERHGAFGAIVAINVVAHTPNLTSLFRGVAEALAEDGVFFMEAAYVENIALAQFDTIYHEHKYCFSLGALTCAVEQAGLYVVDAELLPTQGGSIRLIAKKHEAAPSARLEALQRRERFLGYDGLDVFRAAAKKVVEFRKEYREKVSLMRGQGDRLVALGAPARGVVIANYCGLTSDDLEAVVDDTPLKVGRAFPGVHCPVVGWSWLKANPRERFLLLSWNYPREIEAKLRPLPDRARILKPFPRPEITF